MPESRVFITEPIAKLGNLVTPALSRGDGLVDFLTIASTVKTFLNHGPGLINPV